MLFFEADINSLFYGKGEFSYYLRVDFWPSLRGSDFLMRSLSSEMAWVDFGLHVSLIPFYLLSFNDCCDLLVP